MVPLLVTAGVASPAASGQAPGRAAPGQARAAVPVTATGGTVSVPTSIPADCSTDVTRSLNRFFATLAAGTVVELPAGGCYLVSSTGLHTLQISRTDDVTIHGNGAVFHQTTYETPAGASACGTNTLDSVLALRDNVNLTVDDLTIEGPRARGGTYNCPGSNSEGDAGLMIGGPNDPRGNHGVTLSRVTVENVDGDGIDLYPQLFSNKGLNTAITFENGTLQYIGYHGIVPEGVDGFTFEGNTVAHLGNFMDAEVDFGCKADYASCFANGVPTGQAVWNMSIVGNHFVDVVGNWVEDEGPQGCVPQQGWVLADNTFDAASKADVALDGSGGNPACPTDNAGLTISGNSGGVSGSTCGGSPATAPANCAAIGVDAWSDVRVTGNDLGIVASGDVPYVIATSLCAVTGGAVSGNMFRDAIEPYDATHCFDAYNAGTATSGVVACGNTYGMTNPPSGHRAAPETDTTCPQGGQG